MTKNTPKQEVVPPRTNTSPAVHHASVTSTPANTSRRSTPHINNRDGMTTSRDFEAATPGIGGDLVLRSVNNVEKVTYDVFCEKLGIYTMKDFKNSEHIIEVTKDPKEDVLIGSKTIINQRT